MIYRPGRQNAAADALSRRDEDLDSAQALALSAPEFAIFDDFRREADTLQDIIDKRARDRGRHGQRRLVHGGWLCHASRPCDRPFGIVAVAPAPCHDARYGT